MKKDWMERGSNGRWWGGVNVSEKVWNRRRDLIWRMVNLCYVRIFLDEDEGNPNNKVAPSRTEGKDGRILMFSMMDDVSLIDVVVFWFVNWRNIIVFLLILNTAIRSLVLILNVIVVVSSLKFLFIFKNQPIQDSLKGEKSIFKFYKKWNSIKTSIGTFFRGEAGVSSFSIWSLLSRRGSFGLFVLSRWFLLWFRGTSSSGRSVFSGSSATITSFTSAVTSSFSAIATSSTTAVTFTIASLSSITSPTTEKIHNK